MNPFRNTLGDAGEAQTVLAKFDNLALYFDAADASSSDPTRWPVLVRKGARLIVPAPYAVTDVNGKPYLRVNIPAGVPVFSQALDAAGKQQQLEAPPYGVDLWARQDGISGSATSSGGAGGGLLLGLLAAGAAAAYGRR